MSHKHNSYDIRDNISSQIAQELKHLLLFSWNWTELGFFNLTICINKIYETLWYIWTNHDDIADFIFMCSLIFSQSTILIVDCGILRTVWYYLFLFSFYCTFVMSVIQNLHRFVKINYILEKHEKCKKKSGKILHNIQYSLINVQKCQLILLPH